MGAVVTPNMADMTTLYRGQNANTASMPTINFCDNVYNTVKVYTQGYIDFSDTYYYQYGTLAASNRVIIAPLINNATNWDTALSGPVTYGITTYEGLPAFMVTWDHIGRYDGNWDEFYDLPNTFQLIIQVITSDLWNLILNYDSVQWVNTYSNAGFIRYNSPTMKSYFLLPGSTIPSTLRDGQASALISSHSTGTTVNGRYIYSVRNGAPQGTGWVDPGVANPSPDPLQASSRAFRPRGIYL